MKVYIQSYENNIPHNYNFMNAHQGFSESRRTDARFSSR